MDKFQKIFTEESLEQLNVLENVLLELEGNYKDDQLIDQVFRIIHTLKGNSAMFGFKIIEAYVHNLENIYDLIREHKLELTLELFDITFKSVDHLLGLISDPELKNKTLSTNHKILTAKINEIVNSLHISDNNTTEILDISLQDQTTAISDICTYYIEFIPHQSFLKDGSNPLFLIDDLNSLGKTIVSPNFSKIPEIEELECDSCYISWVIILFSEKEIDEIKDIFIFAEDHCDLEIIMLSDSDLSTNDKFNKKINELKNNHKIDIQELAEWDENKFKEQSKKINTSESPEAGENKTIVDEIKKTYLKSYISSIRVASEKIDTLLNLVSELITKQAELSLLAQQSENSRLIQLAEYIEKIARQFRENAFSISLIPLETILTRFHRMIRDISSKLNKKVEFITIGAETELDKTMIEKITDPIMHIIRNSLDHGIEDPETRIKKGKPANGTITLKSYYSGSYVIIQNSKQKELKELSYEQN